jgi:hypothetical protein
MPDKESKSGALLHGGVLHKKTKVRVLSSTTEASLVEWRDGAGLHRATVQAPDVIDGAASPERLAEGVPYGVPWEEVKFGKFTPAALAQGLRDNGIWTVEDLARNPNPAINVLQTLYKVDLATLLEFARTIGG